MEFTPDCFDDLFAMEDGTPPKVAEAATDVVAAPQSTITPAGCGVVWDIETGPRPWAELEPFYEGPTKLPPFDESMVKYGNAKDPAKRKEKFESFKADYEARLAGEAWAAEALRQEFLSKAALSPITGQVLAIGYSTKSGQTIHQGDEKQTLVLFWETVQSCRKNRTPMIGFNICNFDLPFVVRRSWLHGVDVPAGILSQGRYWDKMFVDLMQVWGCGVWGERISLDKLCGFFGLARKTGSGADFARLLADEATKQQAIDYLKNDLLMTAQAAERLGVL